MSLNKSLLYVFSNVDIVLAKEISNKFGIPLTSDLSKYFLIHFLIHYIHGGVSLGMFKHVLDKVYSRLASLKRKHLSMMGWITLTTFELLSILIYLTQTVELPTIKYDSINKQCQGFIQGNTKWKRNSFGELGDIL